MLLSDVSGHILLIMSPMGGGKSTLIRHLHATFPRASGTVSCTTRMRRPNEKEGVDYYFISRDEFMSRVEQGLFVEWAEFSGNLYGTLKSELIGKIQNGEVIISEIELQGILQMMECIPKENRTVIYIDAGDWETLKARAIARAPITDEELAMRYKRYLEEVKHRDIADSIVYNRDGQIEDAKAQIEAIMRDIFSKIST